MHIRSAEASWIMFDHLFSHLSATALVDSTKTPFRALLLDSIRPGAMKLLWIRRDLSAVFASHLKRRAQKRQLTPNETVAIAKTIRRNAINAHRVFKNLSPTMVSHRNLCSDPQGELNRIAQALGLKTTNTPGNAEIGGSHQVPGNSQVWKGPLHIRPELASPIGLPDPHRSIFERYLERANHSLGLEGT
jgi:hypothetical protein